MSMNLEEKCFHCNSKIGEICKENCEVNGKKIQKLKAMALELDLKLDEKHLKLVPISRITHKHNHLE